ncbi:hypothetical protein CNMCM8980_002055 [Aspergillus fumigatiaffinis]|jgi:hypothetical protein|uniref:Uncharacterized protein n=1 Tax=Aspergillus fumigatiaffinis TaxID=340414 RepID=A0A8H4H453_9EURO|nr:hypothetical protein CNMCM6457_009433 [Aspergillus fumigatiaffinis]KAF4234428.1 hypothetical protein CNMCM6805_008660 [Aspergillus fumigatiaffinis]KAF4238560.1 hypothetical protein CNMCM8980_002055 [Aspergillus fumigatiaffinis]
MSSLYPAQSAEQTAQTTNPAIQTSEDGKSKPTDTREFAHVLFDIKTSPKKLNPILLESLHHRLHHSDVKVYPSFDVLRAAGAVKRGNVVFALPAAGMNVDQVIMVVRLKVQHLIMDWDKDELSGEGLYLVTEDKMCPWGWSFLSYQAWKEQRKRR